MLACAHHFTPAAVGNLSYDLTEQDVIDHFSQVGPVKHVRQETARAAAAGIGHHWHLTLPCHARQAWLPLNMWHLARPAPVAGS